MKKVILIGRSECGKTTLKQVLSGEKRRYEKTQAVSYADWIIDTPGEYMENRGYYTALIVTAADADIIALVYDCTSEENYIAPGFASMFCKDVIGIITKINLAKDKSEIEVAEERLNLAGVSKIFKVDTVDDVGIKELFNYLNKF